MKALAINSDKSVEDAKYHPFYFGKYKDSSDSELRHAHVYDGRYPMARKLFLYVNKKQGEKLALEIESFWQFTLSVPGQKIVTDAGHIRLSKKIVQQKNKQKLQ